MKTMDSVRYLIDVTKHTPWFIVAVLPVILYVSTY